MRLTSNRIIVSNNYQTINQTFIEKQWSDGLPIVPPTIQAVENLLTGTKLSPEEIVASIPPNWSEASVEKIAINSVMAGCRPEYLPVIITAIQAMCEKPFNLFGVQATTHPTSPLLIINGPLGKKLEINSKTGCFGPGWQSNATIGRAIRLILMNIGGAFPGKTAMPTQAQPSRYTFCVAENEEDNPWQPLHVERGYDAATSTVTVCAPENPHNINERIALSGEEILHTIAGSIATMGTNNIQTQNGEPIIAFGPEHAQAIARDGFSKNDVRAFLFEKARIPRNRFHARAIKQYYSELAEEALIPITKNKEDIMILVLGGQGKHSSFMPTFGDSRSITKAIL